MNTICVSEFHKEDSILKDLNLGKTIFWVGSGVSIDPPTGLPSGPSLTETLIKSALGPQWGQLYLDSWRELSGVISDITRDKLFHQYAIEAPVPRLEFLINCIDDVDIELQRARFTNNRMIDSFEYINNYPPNQLHALLAEIFLAGAIIVTPNFDTCIERMLSPDLSDFTLGDHYGVPSYQNRNGCIYHYHGTAQKPHELGATIRKVKSGLPSEFRKLLVDCFEKHYNLICVGFSGSDFFDVTPFFQELANKSTDEYCGKAIFFSYGKASEASLLREKYAAENMFGAFRNKTNMRGNTHYFLDQVCKDNIPNRIVLNTPKCNANIQGLRFPESIYLTKELYLISILKRTGLLLTNQYLCGDYFQYSNLENFMESITEKLLKFDIKHYINEFYKSDKNPSVINEIITICEEQNISIKSLDRLRIALSLDHEITMAANDMTISDIEMFLYSTKNISVIANKSSYIYAFSRLVKESIASDNIPNMKRLLACGDIYLSIPFNEYMYISYYGSIQRRYWELLSMLDFNMFQASLLHSFIYSTQILLEINAMSDVVKNYNCLFRIYRYQADNDATLVELAERCRAYSELINQHIR